MGSTRAFVAVCVQPSIVVLLGTIKVNVRIKTIKCKPQNHKLKSKQKNYFMCQTSEMMSFFPSLPQCSGQKGRQTERNYVSQKSWPFLGFHDVLRRAQNISNWTQSKGSADLSLKSRFYFTESQAWSEGTSWGHLVQDSARSRTTSKLIQCLG